MFQSLRLSLWLLSVFSAGRNQVFIAYIGSWTKDNFLKHMKGGAK